MDRSGRAKRVFWAAVDGLRSLGVTIFLLLLGLADYFDAVNVRPVLDQAVGSDRSARIMVWLPLIFTSLRFVAKGRPSWARRDEDECNQSREH